MEKILDMILKLVDSRSIPTVAKIIVFLSVVALVLSKAGFPVVQYTEGLAEKLWENQKLFGGLVGVAIGLTVAQLSTPLLRLAQTLAVKAVKSERFELADKVLSVVAIYLWVFIVVLAIIFVIFKFLAWTVS